MKEQKEYPRFYCKYGCEYGCSFQNFGNECEQERLWKEKNC